MDKSDYKVRRKLSKKLAGLVDEVYGRPYARDMLLEQAVETLRELENHLVADLDAERNRWF